MRRLLVLAAAFAISHPAIAQDEGVDVEAAKVACYYAGQAYSLNSSIREGDHFLICAGNGGWFQSDKVTSVNCLYASEVYGPGSRIAVGQNGYSCGEDGVWKK